MEGMPSKRTLGLKGPPSVSLLLGVWGALCHGVASPQEQNNWGQGVRAQNLQAKLNKLFPLKNVLS